MNCPRCGTDLGDGLLPARCPACGANLREGSAKKVDAAQSRSVVEGMTGIGKGNRAGTRRHRVQSVIGLLLVVLFCTGLVWGISTISTNLHLLPSVVGWRYERAAAKLEDAGYHVARVDVVDPDIESGLVTAQSPEAQTELDEGGLVTLSVAAERTMPDVVGLSEKEAIQALDAVAIPYTVAYEPSDTAIGIVTASSLKAGANAKDAPTCELTVGKAPTVPDLSGMTKTEVEAALQKAGLKATYTTAQANGKPIGTVVKQDPAPNTEVALDSTVTVALSSKTADLAQETANSALSIIYNSSPDGDSIGQQLSSLLSPDSPYFGKSAHDIWYGLVKGANFHADVDSRIQALPRSISGVALDVAPDGLSAEAQVGVVWDWTPMGEEYAGITSQDTHHVTMTFDQDGKLVDLVDPQSDVPTYRVE